MNENHTVQLIYQAISFKLTREAVTLPNGAKTHWSVVRHPGAACVLPIDGDHVVMVRNYRPALGKWLLEIPGGGIGEGETPEEAARRELREEAGYTAERVVPLGAYRQVQGFSDFLLHFFCAVGLMEVGQQLDAHEVTEVQRVPLAEVMDLLQRGEIEDSQVPMGVLLALLHGVLSAHQHEAWLAALAR